MMVTCIPYLLIQIPGLAVVGEGASTEAAVEKPWAIVGFVLCMGFLGGYLYFQYASSLEPDEDNTVQAHRTALLKEAIAKGEITLLGLMTAEFEKSPPVPGSPRASMMSGSNPTESTPLNEKVSDTAMEQLKALLRPFFAKYDHDNSGELDVDELGAVFRDLGEDVPAKTLSTLFAKFDTDNSGNIDYHEFVKGVAEYVVSRGLKAESVPSFPEVHRENSTAGEDEEEQEEIPEDLAHLSPEEQQYRVKLRAFWMMALGTAIVLVVSDPMVDVLTEIGDRTGISSFYVAFVLAPIASNASEVIASYNYAAKKTSSSIAVSISALQGAAVMNNTFVLGVFLLLIFSQGLYWEFFAETTTILVIEVIIALFSYKKTHTIFDGFMILSLYPASIALCYLLEKVGWD
jgi:Ca2+/Na+ antiporter